jgi:hypothetical protein
LVFVDGLVVVMVDISERSEKLGGGCAEAEEVVSEGEEEEEGERRRYKTVVSLTGA